MVKFLDLQAITMQHGDEYKQAVDRVINSGWFLQGNEIKQFERNYADYIGVKECVTVANGLDALRLILRAYKELNILHENDEIIVPANTYIATILAITENKLRPILVEPTFSNLELDTEKIESALTTRTRGIMTVHLYGRIAFNEQLKQICYRHKLLLMEDCAQSQGCAYKGIKTGALGNAAAHSFYPGKNIGAFGDAGAVTTNDADLAQIIRALANYGSERKYVFNMAGINSRMSEIDAAVLNIKLKYLDADNAKRQKLAYYYYTHINNPLVILPLQIANEQNVYHQFPIFCKERDKLQKHLESQGIGTMIHYPIPPHKQKCYANEVWNIPQLHLPITEKIHAQELSIPMNQSVTEEEAIKVVEAINSFEV